MSDLEGVVLGDVGVARLRVRGIGGTLALLGVGQGQVHGVQRTAPPPQGDDLGAAPPLLPVLVLLLGAGLFVPFLFFVVLVLGVPRSTRVLRLRIRLLLHADLRRGDGRRSLALRRGAVGGGRRRRRGGVLLGRGLLLAAADGGAAPAVLLQLLVDEVRVYLEEVDELLEAADV